MTGSNAFVLIEVTAGNVLKVFRELEQISNIKFCYAITGQYDIIALIEAEDMQKLGRVTINKIQKIAGVLRTVTCNIIDIAE